MSVTRISRITLHLGAVFFGAFFFMLLAGCGEEVEVVEELDLFYFEGIGIGQTGATRDTTEWVLRDSVSWAAAARQFKPLAPFKTVDFRQSVVVVIGIPTESGGYHVEIESIERTEEEGVVISYLFQEPASDCITLTANALPFLAVAAARFEDERVTFERRAQKYECTWKQ
ncbi:MAG: hypothetical protein ACI80V_003756 [Rhodothermales bacterium]